jgi:hypothetical protein
MTTIRTITTTPAITTTLAATLIEHSGSVFRLQFDEFQIVSSRFGKVILVMIITNT